MTTLYLIRHAEADGNVYRRIHGQYDGFVTPRGYKQIQYLARRFYDVNIDAVYSSDLFRTRETARAISEPHGLSPVLCRSLREISFGAWEDMTWGDAVVNHPEEYAIWEKTPHKFKLPDGESYLDIYSRSKAALDKIVSDHPNQSVAVITHGTLIRALLCMFEYGSMDKVCNISWCDNTSVAKIIADENLNYKIEYANDNSHLNELSTLARQLWWVDDTDPKFNNLRFVPAQFPHDLDDADAFYRSAWKSVFPDEPYDSSYTRSRLQRAKKLHPQAVVFACRGENERLGMVALDTKTQLIPHGGHIMLLCLNEEACGAEYGAQLLGHAVSVYRSLGRRYVTVRVAACNKRALKFYDKYAFEQFGAEQGAASLHLLLRKSIDGTCAHIDWK